MVARVVKILSQNYTISIDGVEYDAVPRGSIRSMGKIFVGDNVEVSPNNYGGGYIIESVHSRKNALVRPPIVNLDQLVIVIALSPAPDFELVDKLFIFCQLQSIKPILVINKCDITHKDEIMYIVDSYKWCTDNIIAVSALKRENLTALKKLLRGKLSAFAGQSAVGKSTLINALSDKDIVRTQELSKKTERGKHTTRHTQIYSIGDIYIADTAGFSMLELPLIKYSELHTYYPDFVSSDKCSYSSCEHVNCLSKDCAVVADVECGVIDEGRYTRYVKLYNELKEKWRKKYD